MASTTNYDLPADFDHILNETLYDRTNYIKIFGATRAGKWQQLQASVTSTSVLNSVYRLRRISNTKVLSLEPTPTAISTIAYEYISKYWVENDEGNGVLKFTSDSDVGVIDEYLIELEAIWRMRRKMGVTFLDEKVEARNAIDLAKARNHPAALIDYNAYRPQFVDSISEGDFPTS